MLGIGKRYRVVLRDGGGVRAWSAQSRAQALTGFSQQIADGGFTPWGGPQLMVLSEEEWTRLRGPVQPVDVDRHASVLSARHPGDAGRVDPDGPRRRFRWLSSRSKS